MPPSALSPMLSAGGRRYKHVAGQCLLQQNCQLQLKPACACRVQGAPVVLEWELRLLEVLLAILSADLQPASSGGAAISDILHDADHGQHRLMVGNAYYLRSALVESQLVEGACCPTCIQWAPHH